MKHYIFFDLDGTLTEQRETSTSPFTGQKLLPKRQQFFDNFNSKVRFGIITNQSTSRDIDEMWEHIGLVCGLTDIDMFNVTVLFGDRKKPNTVGLDDAIAQTMVIGCIDRRQILYVGDKLTDKEFAEACGIDFAWAEEFFDNPIKFMLGD